MGNFQITSTIGRNVPGQGELDDTTWGQFQTDLYDVFVNTLDMRQVIFVQMFTSEGGTWNGDAEDSAFLLVVTDENPIDPLDRIKAQLAALAARYEQDAIALSTGVSTLVDRA